MGYIKHHAIIVTSNDIFNDERFASAYSLATATFGAQVSGITEPVVNCYRSFLIGPDGSKEGWDESDNGDKQRNVYLLWLKENCPGCRFVELFYGEDDGKAKILTHN